MMDTSVDRPALNFQRGFVSTPPLLNKEKPSFLNVNQSMKSSGDGDPKAIIGATDFGPTFVVVSAREQAQSCNLMLMRLPWGQSALVQTGRRNGAFRVCGKSEIEEAASCQARGG